VELKTAEGGAGELVTRPNHRSRQTNSHAQIFIREALVVELVTGYLWPTTVHVR